MTATSAWNSARRAISRWLAIATVSLLIYAGSMLAWAWLTAWRMDLPPFREYHGLDGPWDHVRQVELPLQQALGAPLAATVLAAVAVLLTPKNEARHVLLATCFVVVVFLSMTHHWLID